MASVSTNHLSRGLDRHYHEDHMTEGRFATDEMPLTVRDAARYLGVSVQTVYLWVERKQIPHLRVMGRNIRFLKSELEPFRAQFKQEVVNWRDQ
ncbi:MAG: helix-turn-helix domain-containing protein [Bryobacteraceae bacterium]|jgi:excisionase family DNA binding protein